MKLINTSLVRICCLIILLLCVGCENDKPLEPKTNYGTTFLNTFGGASSDWGYSVVQDSDESYVVTGSTRSNALDLDDLYLFKTDVDGNLIWEKTFGGSGFDIGKSVILASDGGYVVAGFTSINNDTLVYLLKTDVDGNLEWGKTFEGSFSYLNPSVCEAHDGGYLLLSTKVDINSFTTNTNIIKTDKSGNIEWEKFYSNDRYSVGTFVSKTNDNCYIFTGYIRTLSTSTDMLLVKVDSVGTIIWEKTIGDVDHEFGTSVIEISSGGFMISGWVFSDVTSNTDIYIIKTDELGNVIWEKILGSGRGDRAYSIIESNDGNFVVAGNYYSIGDSEFKAYLSKIDIYGMLLWEQFWSGRGFSVIQAADGGYTITGFSSVDNNVLLIKTNSDGLVE